MRKKVAPKLSEQSTKGRSFRLEIRLNEMERLALVQKADELGVPVASAARMAIRRFTAEQGE